MNQPNFYTEEEALDRAIGVKGTSLRDEYETDLHYFLIGEAIRHARQSKNLTQEQLGEMIGVKRAQVSRLEKGRNLTLTTISKIFKAMDIPAWLHLTGIGNVAL